MAYQWHFQSSLKIFMSAVVANCNEQQIRTQLPIFTVTPVLELSSLSLKAVKILNLLLRMIHAKWILLQSAVACNDYLLENCFQFHLRVFKIIVSYSYLYEIVWNQISRNKPNANELSIAFISNKTKSTPLDPNSMASGEVINAFYMICTR